jgi:hypothetical protein
MKANLFICVLPLLPPSRTNCCRVEQKNVQIAAGGSSGGKLHPLHMWGRHL